MNNKRLTEITTRAARCNLAVETNRPGDGVRRYFFVLENGHPMGGSLQLAGPLLGAEAASLWLQGFECRHRHAKGA